jgi:hypothetical protein
MLVALVLALAASVLGPQATRVQAGTINITNACKESITQEATQLDVSLTGSSPASVKSLVNFQLTDLGQTLFLPGRFFVRGYNLGLLQTGLNTVPGNVRTIIEGTHIGFLVEATQFTPVTDVSITTTITDPDGTPGTGDETATPAEVTVNYPNQIWTAGFSSTTMLFREDTVTPLVANHQGGIIINMTIGGLLYLQFRCSPGTVDPTTGVISFIDPAPSFATTTVHGEPSMPGDLRIK